MIKVILAEKPDEIEQVMAIRRQVFVEEQQVPVHIERDDEDGGALHFLAFWNGEPAGAGRLVISGSEGRVGRISVLPQFRKRGVGRALMMAVEEAAQRRGLVRLCLHSQDHAERFYSKLGYQLTGGKFVEAGIVHVPMEKPLKSRCGS